MRAREGREGAGLLSRGVPRLPRPGGGPQPAYRGELPPRPPPLRSVRRDPAGERPRRGESRSPPRLRVPSQGPGPGTRYDPAPGLGAALLLRVPGRRITPRERPERPP